MARMPVAERREQLVAAAIAVMTRDGVRAATTRAIVAEAETSLSVFHYCFDSKHELMEAVVDTMVNRSAERSAAAIADGTPVEQMFRSSIYGYWQHVVENPEMHLLSYEVTQYCLRDPDLAAIPALQYRLYGEAIADQLRAVGATASIPIETLARYLTVVVDGLTLDWLVRRDDDSAREVIEAVIAHVNTVMSIGG